MLFYGPEQKKANIQLQNMHTFFLDNIKRRPTNQLFPEKRPVDVSSRPPLPLPRNVNGLTSLKIDFFFRLRLDTGMLSRDIVLIF